MIVGTCAAFERGLAELLASPSGAASRPDLERALREHAAACPGCAPAAALVGWGSRPAAERELEGPPPEGYWDDFDARLARRIDESAAARGRGGARRTAAAAVSILAVGLAASVLVRRGDALRPPAPPVLPVAAVEAGEDAWSEVLPEAEPESSGFGASDGESFYPAVDDLDEAGRQGLLDWLRAEQARLKGGAA